MSIAKAKVGFIEPMLAVAVTKLPEGPAWSYELKFDGYRALGAKAAHRWTEIHLGRSSGQKPPKF